MFNIFRMHMYRVSKATSTLVIGILLVAFLIFGLGMAHLVYNNPLNLDFQTIMGTTGVFGTFTASASHQFFIQGNDGFVILITIFAVILTNCDFTKGFAKNTYSMFEKRRPLVFAKWLALVACITGTYIVYSFVSLGLSAAVIKTFEFGSATEYFLGWLVVVFRMNILYAMRAITGQEIFPKELYLFSELPAHIVGTMAPSSKIADASITAVSTGPSTPLLTRYGN